MNEEIKKQLRECEIRSWFYHNETRWSGYKIMEFFLCSKGHKEVQLSPTENHEKRFCTRCKHLQLIAIPFNYITQKESSI